MALAMAAGASFTPSTDFRTRKGRGCNAVTVAALPFAMFHPGRGGSDVLLIIGLAAAATDC